MWDEQHFRGERARRLYELSGDFETRRLARAFVKASYRHDYCYMWDWMGFPILQMPEDIVALQEILFSRRPTLFVETGVAWGGGIALAASIMSLYDPSSRIVGIDLNLHEDLPSKFRNLNLPVTIDLLKMSSTSREAINSVKARISPEDRVMVVLDSNHTHDHVLQELRLYGPLVSRDQYLIVGDTSAGELSEVTRRIRPWDIQLNPQSAVNAFLSETQSFVRDASLDAKLLTTFHPSGYLLKS